MEIKTSTPDTTVLLGKEQILNRLLENIWHVLLAIILIAGPASILRYRVTGWLPLYSFHVILMTTFALCWLFRKKFSFNTRVGIILGLFYFVGAAGIYTFGLVSAGIWWLILCALIANIFYTLRSGLIHALTCLAIIVGAAIAYTGGYLTVPFDTNEYITRASTWLTLIVGCVFLSFFIIAAITTYQREIFKLLSEVEKSWRQKEELIQKQEQALNEIKALRSLIPICSNCKKVRDDEGFWENVEAYMHKHTDIQFSHGLCPDCGESLYGDTWNEAMVSLEEKKSSEQASDKPSGNE